MQKWVNGRKTPTSIASLAILGRIERRYRLPVGYFKSKLLNRCRAPSGHRKLNGITSSERRRLAWHLPDDFDSRSGRERAEILEWVCAFVISGATDYRRYQAEAAKYRYAIRFPELTGRRLVRRSVPDEDDESRFLDKVELDLTAVAMDAPRDLADEMAGLIRFKTATPTDIGFHRNGVWNESTAFQEIEHLGLLSAPWRLRRAGGQRTGRTGCKLAMGLLVFPEVWDWYIQWRERQRASSRHGKSTCCGSVSR